MSQITKAHIACEVMNKPMSDHGARLRQQRESIISCHSATATGWVFARLAAGQPSTTETTTAPCCAQEDGLSTNNCLTSCRALLRRSSTLVQASRSATANGNSSPDASPSMILTRQLCLFTLVIMPRLLCNFSFVLVLVVKTSVPIFKSGIILADGGVDGASLDSQDLWLHVPWSSITTGSDLSMLLLQSGSDSENTR